MIKRIDVYKLYEICNKEKLFTCGTNAQYEQMFELAASGLTKKELAYILYICSDLPLEKILAVIEPLFTEGGEV